MSQTPEGLLYSREHEWVKIENNTATVGITDHAQAALGDVVYVDLTASPQAQITQGETVATIESVKAVSDIYAPVSGKITEINKAINADPSVVNRDPYGNGWLFQLDGIAEDELNSLMSPSDYKSFIATL